MNCPNYRFKNIVELKEETKIVKLPEILIFTLERYQGPTNNVLTEPDDIIDMNKYI